MSDPAASALCVRDLAKRYDRVEAVRGVSFDVAAGEIFGLLGRNGAGKTTTLECILGLRRPDAGAITVAGLDALAQPARAKALLGAQLQAATLQDKITPRQALALFGSFYADAAPPADLLSRFALTEKADAPFDSLSGGQRQRLFLALAFVNRPKILILDEPTAGLDPQARRDLHELIVRVRAQGCTVLLSTHDLAEAATLCDRVGVLHEGRLLSVASPDSLVARARAKPRIFVRTARTFTPSLLPHLIGAERRDGAWLLHSADASETILALAQQLRSERNELLDLQILRPTLEDAFLALTGLPFAEATP
ncbi:MAG TPA: ABC transporter ATP-binding protein [Opitutus sp.]|nr:ABC transporter ATP-binding protein [Opitutus sp.]